MNYTQKVMSLLIGTPAYGGQVSTAYVRSLILLQEALARAKIYFELVIVDGMSILPMARNIISDTFLRSRHTHLLFIDADMGFRADDIIKMIDITSCDVSAGLYPKKDINWPAVSRFFRNNSDNDGFNVTSITGNFSGMFKPSPDQGSAVDIDQPFLADYVPTGMMLISRSAFSKMIEYGVEEVFTRFGESGVSGNKIHVFFDNSISNLGYYQGEDFTFCERLRRAGGIIVACPWFIVSHVGQMSYEGNLKAIADAGLILD